MPTDDTQAASIPAERTIPSPPINPENQRYWDAADAGRLLVGRCGDCGEHHFFPRPFCPHCFSERVAWVEAAGGGTILSFSIMRRGAPVPYAIAYVTLDEGVSMLTNIVDMPLDAIRIGQRVRVVFRESERGRRVPMFAP